MYELTCACGADLRPSWRFCPDCGDPAPELPTPPPSSAAPQEQRVENALVHVLRDIEDNHVGLWGRPGDIVVDRVVSARLRHLDWPQLMLERGWVAPDRSGHGERLTITAWGREVLAAAGWRGTGR